MRWISKMRRIYYWYSDFLDFVYVRMFNPHRVQPYGYCPIQAEGQLKTGEYYYFRSRNESWAVYISNDENERFTEKSWVHRENKYQQFEGGWITRREAIKNLNKAVKLYYKHKLN